MAVISVVCFDKEKAPGKEKWTCVETHVGSDGKKEIKKKKISGNPQEIQDTYDNEDGNILFHFDK